MTDQPAQQRESRRRHQKSRKGCITCKRRRIKCDEGRPRCDRCTFSNRQCSYQNPNPQSPRRDGSAPNESPHEDLNVHRGCFTAMDLSFLHHAECNLADFMALQGDVKPIIRVAIDNALTAPYLLDQLLALSALHRATSDPAMACVYHKQATEMQTRALSVFNKAKAHLSESNHLTSFLFATLLGVHVLCDTLAGHQQVLPEFVCAFVSYARLHRGVRAVTGQYWKDILQSDLKPLLYIVEWTDKADQLEPGTDTADMRRFLGSSCSLSPSSLTACLSALTWVQWVLDMIRQEPTRFDLAVHATMAWPILIPDDYINCLYKHQPEALAILSYYAAIVHRYRAFWVFGNSGSVLVRSIARHIGPFWDPALAWPRGQLAQY